jgi:hypothetical protein
VAAEPTVPPLEFVAAHGDVKSLLTLQEIAFAYYGERSPEGPAAVRAWEARYPERCGE